MQTHTWPVFGHDWAVDHLRKGISNGRVRHAYLFTGVESVGKETLARAFAMTLNCADPDEAARPCLNCRACKLIRSGNHPDILYSELDPNSGALKIEEIRDVAGRLALKPYEARYRIAIFRDFDRAQPRAQDALLKTLEEPPPQALLILLAQSGENLLSTITSRSQLIALRPLPVATVYDALSEGYGATAEQAEFLAQLSAGRLGWALQVLENPDTLDQRSEALDLLENCLAEKRAGRFDLAESLGKDKLALRPLAELWQTYWRDLLHLTLESGVAPANADRRAVLEHLAGLVSPAEALAALQATNRLLRDLRYNLNTRLALEVMFLDYPGLER